MSGPPVGFGLQLCVLTSVHVGGISEYQKQDHDVEFSSLPQSGACSTKSTLSTTILLFWRLFFLVHVHKGSTWTVKSACFHLDNAFASYYAEILDPHDTSNSAVHDRNHGFGTARFSPVRKEEE